MVKQKRTYLIIKSLFLLVFLLVCLFKPEQVSISAQSESEDYYFVRSFGGGADQVATPFGITVGPQNQIYVINNGRMTVINQNQRTFDVWENFHVSLTLYDNHPAGLAVDSRGNVFFPDRNGDRIVKYSASGEMLTQFGESGTDPGQFKKPYSIAFNNTGQLFVADYGNSRIQVLSPDGDFVRQWTGQTLTTGHFSPYAIALDSVGNVYVVDISNRCIQKFDSAGNFQFAFGSEHLNKPRSIAIDSQSRIFIVDKGFHSVEVFQSNGNHVTTIGSRNVSGDDEGQFQWPYGISLDKADNIYIADTYNHRVQKFSPDGDFITAWGTPISQSGEFNTPLGLSFDTAQHLLVIDNQNDRLQGFDSYGNFLFTLGTEGSGTGQFQGPRDVTLDLEGNIFVADHGNDRIQKFDTGGTFLMSWGEGTLSHPSGLVYNPSNGYVYVVDTGNHQIRIYEVDGNLVGSWGGFGQDAGEFNGPMRIAVDSAGDVFVTDANNDRIQKFDQNGVYQTSWGSSGVGNGEFNSPVDIAINPADEVFITDGQNHRIQYFDTGGNWLGAFGEFGKSPEQFNHPNGIAIGPEGEIIISDSGNNRIQVFSPTPPEVDPETGLIQNGGFTDSADGWTRGGDLPITLSESTRADLSLRLNEPVPQTEQGQGQAWAYSNFFVPETMERPVLSFKYKLFVNDILHYSDFIVVLQDGVGLHHLNTIMRDGYQPCTPGVAPAAGTNLGWREVEIDLSAHKGEHLRLMFANRNLWDIAWGIWTYVDDVMVVDEPVPWMSGAYFNFVPSLMSYRCDPLPDVP